MKVVWVYQDSGLFLGDLHSGGFYTQRLFSFLIKMILHVTVLQPMPQEDQNQHVPT